MGLIVLIGSACLFVISLVTWLVDLGTPGLQTDVAASSGFISCALFGLTMWLFLRRLRKKNKAARWNPSYPLTVGCWLFIAAFAAYWAVSIPLQVGADNTGEVSRALSGELVNSDPVHPWRVVSSHGTLTSDSFPSTRLTISMSGDSLYDGLSATVELADGSTSSCSTNWSPRYVVKENRDLILACDRPLSKAQLSEVTKIAVTD